MQNKYPLMRNNIHREDLDAIIEYLKQDDPILTNGANVLAFEKEWSRWLGVKYSVFVMISDHLDEFFCSVRPFINHC